MGYEARNITFWIKASVKNLEIWIQKILIFFNFFRLGEEQPEFVQAVADKKPAFSRMITKAAVVIYGLPSLNYTTTTQNSVNKWKNWQ